MVDKDGLVIVKDELKHSFSYHRSLYADDVYTPTTQLNAENPQNCHERQQHDVSRQYHWMPTETADSGSVMDRNKGNKQLMSVYLPG